MATRIDTSRTYESIHDAGVEAAAARAITAAIEAALSASQEQLATKNDLQLLRAEVLGEIGTTRNELAVLRGETNGGTATLRGEMQALSSDLEKSIADAQLKTVLWLGGVMLALAGVVLAGFGLL